MESFGKKQRERARREKQERKRAEKEARRVAKITIPSGDSSKEHPK